MPFIELLHGSPGFFYLSVGLLGLVIGSFLNVVIARLPVMMERAWRRECCDFLGIENTNKDQAFNLLTPSSRCPACEQPLSLLENIPLLSYLFLGGSCARCKARIAYRYPLVESLACLVGLAVAVRLGVTLQTLLACGLAWSLIVLAFIDLDKQLLPDEITLPLLWAGISCNLFGTFEQTLSVTIQSSLIGCMGGYLALWLVFHIFRLLTGKHGMGYGDFKLLAALGAWLGWPQLPIIIMISSLSGAVIGIILILLGKHKRAAPIPFGPYLALGGFVSLIWGADILALLDGG